MFNNQRQDRPLRGLGPPFSRPLLWALCISDELLMESYLDIKNDVAFLVEETIRMGAHVQGGLGRACEEYWLDALHINQHGPCFLTKFMASIAILKMHVANELEHNQELKEIALYLVAKLSEAEIKSMNEDCIKEILRDSKEIYEFNWYVIHSCISRNA